MRHLRQKGIIAVAGSLLAVFLWGPATSCGEERVSRDRIPEGVFIKLNKEFYEALKEEGERGAKVYSNDPSAQYLREISISSRFMVETNLQLLKQQERIIQLLHSLLADKKK